MPIFVPFLTAAKELSIDLAEPVVILRGTAADDSKHVLQGEVNLVLTRPISVSEVNIKFIGKSYSLWPEGIGHKSNKLYHKKTLHMQTVTLKVFNDGHQKEGVITAGIHRWPFQFILSNGLTETIEDEMAKVFYYLTATVHRTGKGTTKLQSRQDVLILRIPNWSDTALTANSLPSSSITSERRLETCDAIICIEKSYVSSGTQFPIALTISPNMKHVFIESISVILTEKRKYRLPEFQARRMEQHDFKLSLTSFNSLADGELATTRGFYAQPTLKDMRRILNVKNAHIPLDEGAFRHRLQFTLPNCVQLNHTSTFSEISIKHTLRIQIDLSSPTANHKHLDLPKAEKDTVYSKIYLETPITILDCRLKEDYNTLPTYEEALLVTSVSEDDLAAETKPSGFFMCPCYLEYKKKTQCNRRDWVKIRDQFTFPSGPSDTTTPPPSYESLQ